MILVLDDEVDPDYRYLGPEIARLLPDAEYHVYVEEPILEPPTKYDGVVISGSTASVYDESYSDWVEQQGELVRACLRREIPLLGICFGHQLINYTLGGTVERDRRRSTFVEMDVERSEGVLDGVNSLVPVLHSDLVVELGDGMQSTATTDYNENFCSRHEDAPVWTVQFHPEFTCRVSGNPSDWTGDEHLFEKTNATRVLDNFARFCESV